VTRIPISIFGIFVVGLACAGGYLSYYGLRLERPKVPPASELVVREHPISFVVHRSLGRQRVPIERVVSALDRLLPRSESTHWNVLLHQMHLWGANQQDIDQAWRKKGSTEVFFDSTAAMSQFGVPIPVRRRFGYDYLPALRREQQGEWHTYQTLATLAEMGVPSIQTVKVQGETLTVADAVRSMAANLENNQELEWAVVAAALYLPPQRCWRNKFDQVLDFDTLCTQLCDRPLGKGSCMGTHTLYALAVLLMSDKQESVLSPMCRRRAIARLQEATAILEANQRSQGYWIGKWYPDHPDLIEETPSVVPRNELLVTGHHLEWLALMPSEIPLRDGVAEAGCEYLVSTILAEAPELLDKYYCPYTHAGSALMQWEPEARAQVLQHSASR
jgi:hypothetical protein